MRDVDAMIHIEGEMLTTRARILTVGTDRQGYSLNNRLISPQVVRDMVNDGWIYEEDPGAYCVAR